MESASRNRQRLVWVLILLIVSRTMPNCVVSMNSTLKTTTTGVNETASVGAVWTDFQCTDFSAHYEKCRSVRNRINLNARVTPVSRNTTSPVSVLAQNYTAMKVGRAFVTNYRPVISVIGIVGNILSLIVSLREHNRKITGSWYIAALAVADLWVVVSALMQWIMGIFFPDNRHPIACKVAMFISDVGNLCGTRLLIAMGYDRYKAISAPLERPRWRTVKVTRYIIGLIFIVDLVGMSHFFWFDFTFDLHMGCSVKEASSWLNMTVYSVCRFAIDSIIPFLLIFGCDMLLLKALKNRYKDLRPLTTAAQESFKQCEDNEPNAISAEEARTGAAERKSRKTAGKTDIQLAVMLVTVSIAFLCLMSPPLIARILVFSIEYRHDPRLFANMSMAIQVTTQAMVTKSCINVFLYLLTGSKFRRDLRALFCKTPVRPAHLKRRNAARRGRGRADANDVGSTTNSVTHDTQL